MAALWTAAAARVAVIACRVRDIRRSLVAREVRANDGAVLSPHLLREQERAARLDRSVDAVVCSLLLRIGCVEVEHATVLDAGSCEVLLHRRDHRAVVGAVQLGIRGWPRNALD